jgi:outer membrane murein-binding lipoprotein Lpp
VIEPIMFFGIGFLVASVVALGIIPLVHNRAVRLTMRRLEAATPLSMAEIQADKDQLRAEFAMSTRRLEMSVDQLKAKTTSQLAELGKKSDAINRLKLELGEKTAAIFALEAREKALRDQIRATEQEYAIKTNTMREAERALSDKESDLARLTAELGERTVVSDSQRIEIVALRSQVETLKAQIERIEWDVKDTGDRLSRQRSDADAATNELGEERDRVDHIGNRVVELERNLVAQTTEAEILGRRAQDLEARLTEQGRRLAEREYETKQLRDELEHAHRIEMNLRAELAAIEGRHGTVTDGMRAEQARLEDELGQAQEEHARVQQEIGLMQRDAETSWAAERMENALLRERINDIAAEVARLTVVLEGPDSPIEGMLANDNAGTRPEANGTNGAAGANGGNPGPGGTLADRIRALQSRASRLTAAS